MSKAPLFPDIFIDEIKIPHESSRSKYVFSVYLEHDANITWKQLAELTGYNESTIIRYSKKYNYKERANTFLSYKIKARAEYGIHQGNLFDANHFEMANAEATLLRKTLVKIQELFNDFLATLQPHEVWKFFKELQTMQKINLEVGHDSKQSLIDSLQYIAEQKESGDITDTQAQELMRDLYKEWFEKPKETVQQIQNETQNETKEQ